MLWGQMSTWGHLGHSAQILIFTENALTLLFFIVYSCNSQICISLRPSIFLGVIWGHLGSNLMFTKMHYSFMLLSIFLLFIHLHHICGINRETGVSQGSMSHSRQDTPSVTAAYVWFLLSIFFLLLLATLLRLKASTCLDRFQPNWSQEPLTHGIYVIWPQWGQRSRRGHRGQKVNFLKNASTPSNYAALTSGLYICYSLTPSTKVMGIENHPGSFGVMGVERSFSPKMLQLL